MNEIVVKDRNEKMRRKCHSRNVATQVKRQKTEYEQRGDLTRQFVSRLFLPHHTDAQCATL